MADVRASRRGRQPTPWWSAFVAVLSAIAVVLAPAHAAPYLPANTKLASHQLELSQLPADPVAMLAVPGVVTLDTRVNYQGVIGNGSGIVLDPNGTVMTNYHVVQGADEVTATTTSGQKFGVQLLGYNRRLDIALVQLRGAGGLIVPPIGDSARVVIGEPIVAIGNAGGQGALTRSPGAVTALGRSIIADDSLTGATEELSNLIEVAADVRAGDSGGALVNTRGEVIGVIVAASVNYRMGTPGGKGFAIPINDAMGVANQIRSRAPSPDVHIGPPAMLGVGVVTAPPPPGAPPGVTVRDVLPGTPAQQAGLVSGDLITAINGVPVDSATALTYALDRFYPGDVVDVAVSRGGQPNFAKVPLMAGPGG